jgi:hypothetical protein
VIIAMDFTTAALAIGVLKPMRRHWLATIGTRSDSASLHQPPVVLAE